MFGFQGTHDTDGRGYGVGEWEWLCLWQTKQTALKILMPEFLGRGSFYLF
jgi:hypothetical protein